MDIKLLTPEECYEKFIPAKCCQDALDLFKDIQRNAIEVAVQRCRQDARIIFNFYEEEHYVDIISILDCKRKLFEENNLI